MKKILLLLMLFAFAEMEAQIIFDFETPETSTNYRYFGSSLEGDTAHIVDNPNPSGVNMSSKVIQYIKAAGSEPWAGAYADPAPADPIDVTFGGQICADIHFNHLGNLGIKVEASSTGGENWLQTAENTEVNAWQTVCVDVADLSLDPPMMTAIGNIYTQLVIFPDFQIVLEEPDTFYIDNIKLIPGESSGTALYDFEDTENPPVFTYFGSSLDGTDVPIIDNPNATGINESSKVLAYTRAAGSEVWAGAAGNPGLDKPVNVMEGNSICVDVHFDHIGNLAIKLENSATDADGWIRTMPNTVMNEWETLCFSLDSLSIEGEAASAVGHIYPKLTIFPDFQEAPGEMDVTTYLDNFIYDGALVDIQTSNVTFRVDASEIEVGENGMFLAGDAINGWDGSATPMADDDEDGVWEVTVELPEGPVEYKFVNSGTFEDVAEGDCTIVSGDFINRFVEVGSSDLVLPIHLFGSCDSPAPGVQVLIYDFETEETSTDFRYFGGSIDGDSAAVIANPNPTGINMSPNVIQFVKPAGSMTWAGAAADPAPVIDVTAGGEICVDVHFDHIGNLAVKLEQSSTGGGNWITTVANTKVNEWETLCFDVSLPSEEDPFTAATGNIYNQIVLFTDFGTSPEANDTSYIDNIILNTFQAPAEKYDVTFSVDMNNETVGENGVFLSGGLINNWSSDATPMADEDEDGIYEVTVELAPGDIEYKFVNSGTYEEFAEAGDCNIVSGDFINRLLDLGEADTIVHTYIFNSCALSSDVKDLSFDTELFTVKPTVTADFITLSFGDIEEKRITVLNANGQVIELLNAPKYESERILNVSNFASGIYFIKVDTPTKYGIRKIVVE